MAKRKKRRGLRGLGSTRAVHSARAGVLIRSRSKFERGCVRGKKGR